MEFIPRKKIVNLKKATRSKIIADIRLYKSDVDNVDGNSLPKEFADRSLNAKVKRIVMKLREAGFVLDEYVDALYKELDSQFQTNASTMSTDVFRRMSPSELNRAAYFGNEEAAFYLCNEKLKTQGNKDTSSLLDPQHDSPVYWLRIGAQNGSEKCKERYVDLLKTSSNEYDNIRTAF